MPNSGGGLGYGMPRGVWSGDTISGGMGEGPGATKGSKQKAVKPTMLKGNLSYKTMVKWQKKTMGKAKTFMPNMLVDIPKRGHKS